MYIWLILCPLLSKFCLKNSDSSLFGIFQAQTERADNNALRLENEKIQCENLAFKEALKNVICPTCGGPPVGEEERQLNLQKLRMENSQLKQDVCSFPRKFNFGLFVNFYSSLLSWFDDFIMVWFTVWKMFPHDCKCPSETGWANPIVVTLTRLADSRFS